MSSKTAVALGIDIGGTNTKFGLVDADARIHLKQSIATEAHKSPRKLFERLFQRFHDLCPDCVDRFNVRGIGIGAPNGNYYTGGIENPPNLGWGTVNLVELARNFLDIPTVVTNDANAAALGEMKFGRARGMENFMEITLGTGLGSGIVVNGQLVYGHDGFAGEMGHVIVDRNPDARLCGCGRYGCLEAYASAPGMVRTASELLARSNMQSVLRDIPLSKISAKIIYDTARQGDNIARETFEVTGRILGEALADAVALFSPQAIILFGGPTSAGELLFKPVKQHMEQSVLGIFKNKVSILPSGLPPGEAAIMGAAALIWHELNHSRS